MKQVLFVGGSYALPVRFPGRFTSRTVNLIPLPVEDGSQRRIFKDLPGLTVFANIGGGTYRGGKNVLGRMFVVIGATLYEVFSGGTYTSRGTLSTSTGLVDMDFNTTQLGISDASNLYVLTLATNAFASVASYPGGGRFQYLNQYGLFRHRDSGKFGWTDLANFASINALSFATAERSPDNTVGVLADHGEVLIGGTESFEVWSSVPTEDVFQRNDGAQIETGLAAEFTLQDLDGSVFWLSQDSRGQGHVMKMAGYQPSVVSTEAITQQLQDIDLSSAYAFTMSLDKSQFYCLQVPALSTTLVYDTFTGLWHEWAELVNGDYTKHRAIGHVYAFNKHIVGNDSGVLYYFDSTKSTNAGDTLVRDRIFPDEALPSQTRKFYSSLELSCETGRGGVVSYRSSNDGGASWGSWRQRSMGAIGQRLQRVKWDRDGSARDRVRHIRVTSDVPFNPVATYVE